MCLQFFRPFHKKGFIIGFHKIRPSLPGSLGTLILIPVGSVLHDVYQLGCPKALVISNDSDLAEPIRLAVAHGAVVGVVNPHRQHKMSRHLKNVASFNLQLRQSTLPSCQLPNPVIGRRGKQIHKPKAW